MHGGSTTKRRIMEEFAQGEKVVCVLTNPNEALGTPVTTLRGMFGMGQVIDVNPRKHVKWPSQVAKQIKL